MPSERTKQLFARWRKAKGDKGLWNEHWDDLARVQLPRRMGFASTTIEGERRTEDIFDGTPMQGARGFANALGAFMRPDGLPKADMKVDDDRANGLDEVKVWFQIVKDRLRDGFNNPKARYRQASGEIDQDLVVFGTAIMFLGESISRSHLFCQSVHLKDATIVFDEEGETETFFRERQMPLHQLIRRFGEGSLSDKLRQQIKEKPNDLDKKIAILHAVAKREGTRPGALFARDLPFSDQWFEIDGQHELQVGGFHEFPFIVSRWDTTSGEDYGRSPGMIALPDSDTLQAMGETILIAGQRAADPPLAVPNDGTVDAVNTFPGGLAYYDVDTAERLRGSPFFPMESGANLPISRDMQRDTREQVFAAFFKNVLNLPIEGPEMTATEIIARKEEFMRELGPVFGKLETERTAPEVNRGFMIMLRAGAFNPIPEAIQGKNLVFEYDSPVKRIGQQIEAAAAKRWASEVILLSERKPEALDLINTDELVRFDAEASGIPQQVVNSVEVVNQIRQQRAQAEEAQRQALVLQESTDILKTGAEAANAAGLVNQG